jgi:hypothetical protein
MALNLNDFDAGKSITWAIGWVCPENLFWPQMALFSLLIAISWPKKFLIFRTHPFQWPLL